MAGAADRLRDGLAEILADRADGCVRVAALRASGRLADLFVECDARPSLTGAVVLGRVERIAPALDAAFVDLGEAGGGRPGLLAAGDIRDAGDASDKADTRDKARRGAHAGERLRAGQMVVVQVKADAVGAKGPVLTMDVALPGRFLVHVPKGRGIAVSRRLGAGDARAALMARLSAATVGEGWIARAGAATVDPALLSLEADALAAAWSAMAAAAAAGGAPRRLAAAPGVLERALTELAVTAPVRILVDDAGLAGALARWCDERAPDLAGAVVRHKGPPGLFDMRDLDSAIAALAGPRVPLAGGGSLVIEPTEALTAIDVNAGERSNALAVNLEAAAEIARQIRLRNIGGIVVVDFVNMRGRGDGERLLGALAGAVADDPVQTQVYGMSALGLVELTRARRGPSLAVALGGGAR
jgi:ribonuclease E/ribonuclease G